MDFRLRQHPAARKVPRGKPQRVRSGIELGSRKFRLPVVPANMKTVVDESICEWLAQTAISTVMHRFDLDNVAFHADHEEKGPVRIHLAGCEGLITLRWTSLVALGLAPEYITIDIAHGHADSVRKAMIATWEKLPSSFIIARAMGTPGNGDRPGNWGADAARWAWGPGKVCITKLKTGFGTGGWQLSALKWCAAWRPQAHHRRRWHPQPWRHRQSMRFGATMVMIGSLSPDTKKPWQDGRSGRTTIQKEYHGSTQRLQQG